MADYRFGSQVSSRAQTQVEIDRGLRSYMLGVYNYMALGVAVTAIITLAVAMNPAAMAAVNSLRWVFFLAILALGFVAPRMIFSGNTAMAQAAYWGYVALWGLGMAPMVGHYLAVGPGLVTQAFLISAVTFGATSLAGYITKRDLSGFGAFFMMAAIGIIVAIVANALFFGSSMFSLLTSVVTVLLFAGVTAYETQMIKEMYLEGDAAGVAQGKSIFGAFALYGSFVTIFIHVLNILGIMRNQ
jgi:uncharacterized protein